MRSKEVSSMNALVAYFSASGTTAKAAKVLAKAADADLYEIKPAIPYTRADLNWMDKGSRSSVEMRDKHSRPALADTDAPIAGHAVIFLGFPGGMLLPLLSTPSWRVTTLPARPLSFLPPPAAAGWANRLLACAPVCPVPGSWMDDYSTDG